MKKSAIKCVTNNVLAHKSATHAIEDWKSVANKKSKCIIYATQITNEFKSATKLFYPDTKNLPQMQFKHKKSATNII